MKNVSKKASLNAASEAMERDPERGVSIAQDNALWKYGVVRFSKPCKGVIHTIVPFQGAGFGSHPSRRALPYANDERAFSPLGGDTTAGRQDGAKSGGLLNLNKVLNLVKVVGGEIASLRSQ